MAQWKSGEEYPVSPSEVAQVDWLTTDEICSLPDLPEWERISIEQAERLRLDLGWT